MNAKKNPDIDVNRNSSLYFAIGLCLMLFTTYSLLNYKTYDKDNIAMDVLEVEEFVEEDVPITEQIKTPPPPPPPPAAVEEITIVEDVEEIEETIIESTETSQEEVIAEREVLIEEVEVEEVEEIILVPFAVVERVPIWPGCKGKNNAELKKCFQEKITNHISSNFKYPDVALELGIHGKVFVMFAIDENGYITGIKTRGPDKSLEKEAHRIISKLPKMVPGKQRGRNVKVPYSIPISFKLDNQ
ncbi:MAG: energy transducer TonB [Flavobacteriaceae bacterium]|nr:energy transducer TonB [Bacteroidia bacterium]NNK82929.1 energy transducer TonB [Flavobacteriaceae bacterium]